MHNPPANPAALPSAPHLDQRRAQRGLAVVPSVVVPSVVVIGALVAGLVACSGGGPEESVFAPAPERQAESGPAASFDPGATQGPKCEMAAVDAFKPAVAKPAKLAQNACSAAELSGFFDACLAGAVDQRKCDDFKAAHGKCAACVESTEADAQQGPIVWRANRAYFTVNIPGCIAAVANDMAPTGCGYAYEAALQCQRAACSSCIGGGTVSFQPFSDCQKSAAGSVCKSAVSEQLSACGNIKVGAPGGDCLPPSGSSAPKDAYLVVAPKFCGPG